MKQINERGDWANERRLHVILSYLRKYKMLLER